MPRNRNTHSPDQLAIVRWTTRFGFATAPALAQHGGWTLASARGRLRAAERAGLLSARRVLADAPTLYTVTREGLRESGVRGLEPARVSVSGAPHAVECARVAAALERAYPDHHVMSERELRRDEREAGVPLASASLGDGPDGSALLHRPDVVLWPEHPAELPVAVEVELTVKGARRLLEICRAWARCRCVAGTLYLAAPEVQRPLARAIAHARADGRIAMVALDVLDAQGTTSTAEEHHQRAAASTVPSDA
jgi:hypothetical protein